MSLAPVRALILGLLAIVSTLPSPPLALAQWERIGTGIGQPVLTAIGFSRSGRTFGMTPRSIYLLDTSGAPSRLLCDLQGGVAISAVSDGTLIAGGPMGVVRSDDDGDTWRRVSSQGMREMEHASDGTLFALEGSQLLRSLDTGNTWQVLPQQVDNYSVIAVRTNGDVLLAYQRRFMRSTDRGNSFTHLESAPFTSCIVATSDNGVLVYDHVTMRSDDLARWDTVSRELNCDMRAGPGTVVHARPVFGQTLGGLYRSDDNGRTWRIIARRNPAFYSGGLNGATWISSYRTHVSFDTARSWRMVVYEPSLFRGWVGSIIQRAGDPLFVMTSWGDSEGEYTEGASALYRSTDEGRTWELALDSVSNHARVVSPAPGLLVFTDRSSAPRTPLMTSVDSGRTWDTLGLPTFFESYDSRQLPGNDEWEVALSTSHGIALSRTPFAEWTLAETSPPFARLALLANGTIIGEFSKYGDYPRRSTDGGRTWTKLMDSADLWDVSAAANGAAVAVVSSQREADNRAMFLLRSEDSGESWDYIDRSSGSRELSGFGPEAGYVVLVQPAAEGRLNQRTTDGGATWHSIVSARAVDNPVVGTPGNVLAIASAPGERWLMRSTDTGASWQRFIGPDEADYVTAYESSPGGWTFLGTTDGLFRNQRLSSTPLNPDPPPPPGILAGVLPNPARDHVIVFIDVGKAANIDIELHDMLGNLVRRASHACAPGRRSVRLDTDGLTPGAYALTVSNGERRDGFVIIVER